MTALIDTVEYVCEEWGGGEWRGSVCVGVTVWMWVWV